MTSAGTDSTTGTLDPAHRVLAALAGAQAQWRPDQLDAVRALQQPGARVLVVQATGWGKSAVYWAATAQRRAAGEGVTLVVSPLISLMRDQVAAAAKGGLVARTLNSGNVGDWSRIESELRAGEVDVLLVSPERLANPGFGRRVLDSLTGHLGLLVIDEAHAVSDWGHDFRPDYRRLTRVLQQLSPATPVLATTATANQRVTDDVAAQLGAATLVLRGPLARNSLQLSVVGSLSPIQRYAWVVDHLPRLPGSGIVYTLTVADAERLTAAVRAVHGDAVPVAAYTGGLATDERERLEDALRDNQLKALVSTSALGMGYDKPDLGFVVHVGAPPSPVSYYQQVGRAGRAIEHASVVLLPSEADAGVWDYFATSTIPKPDEVRRLLDTLAGASPDDPATVPALESESGLRRSKVELLLKQLAVDDIVVRAEKGWHPTGREWSYDREHYDSVIAVRRREADIMREYVRGGRCLMQLLQESLDDPQAQPCGRCSVCIGALPETLHAQPAEATVRAISTELRGQVLTLEPRKMWPGGAFGARGRIPAELAAEPGRVLVHADAPEWADTLAAARSDDDAAVAELADAAVTTLANWRHHWAARPEVVISLDTRPGSVLAARVSDRIAEVGRLERATLTPDAAPPEAGATSSDEAAAWRAALVVPDPLKARGAGRVVLLVVDSSASGWVLTVASAALREAGADRVLPLLIHRPVG